MKLDFVSIRLVASPIFTNNVPVTKGENSLNHTAHDEACTKRPCNDSL